MVDGDGGISYRRVLIVFAIIVTLQGEVNLDK